MGGLYGPKYCGQALLIVVGVFCCSFLCTGAAVLSPSVKTSFAVAASGRKPVASLLPPLSTDDAAAISAVATSVEWGFCPQSPSHSQHSRSSEIRGPERLQRQLLLQIVGLLPAVGRSKPGGSWEPTKWYGRPLPRWRRGNSQPFAVRLVQPNIYVRTSTTRMHALMPVS